MNKRRLGPVPLLYPVSIVLVGAMVDGRANFATIGDCAIMGIRPALVAVSLCDGHFTTRGVRDRREFSINLPTSAQLALVDHFGHVSGREVDKSRLVAWRPGDLLPVPLIDDCPANLECRVLQDGTVQHRHFFVAEVLEAHLREDLLRSGVASEKELGSALPDLRTFDPILYALDGSYYRVGGEPITVEQAEGKGSTAATASAE